MQHRKQIIVMKASSEEEVKDTINNLFLSEIHGVSDAFILAIYSAPFETWIEELSYSDHDKMVEEALQYLQEISATAPIRATANVANCVQDIQDKRINGMVRFYNLTDMNFKYPKDTEDWFAVELSLFNSVLFQGKS